MDESSKFGKHVWQYLYLADLNTRYFIGLQKLYSGLDDAVKFVIAITSSAFAIASWKVWQEGILGWLWKILSGVATVAAVVPPLLKWADKAAQAGVVVEGWTTLLREYECLYSQLSTLDSKEALSRFEDTSVKEDELSRKDRSLPKYRWLIKRCEEQIRVARGLQIPEK